MIGRDHLPAQTQFGEKDGSPHVTTQTVHNCRGALTAGGGGGGGATHAVPVGGDRSLVVGVTAVLGLGGELLPAQFPHGSG